MTSVVATSEASLAQFVQLGRTLKDLGAMKNIEKAVSHPGTFVFGELLELENVRALSGTQFKKSLALLELFAYGTVTESKTNASQLPPLTDVMMKKVSISNLSLFFVHVRGEASNLNYVLTELPSFVSSFGC